MCVVCVCVLTTVVCVCCDAGEGRRRTAQTARRSRRDGRWGCARRRAVPWRGTCVFVRVSCLAAAAGARSRATSNWCQHPAMPCRAEAGRRGKRDGGHNSRVGTLRTVAHLRSATALQIALRAQQIHSPFQKTPSWACSCRRSTPWNTLKYDWRHRHVDCAPTHPLSAPALCRRAAAGAGGRRRTACTTSELVFQVGSWQSLSIWLANMCHLVPFRSTDPPHVDASPPGLQNLGAESFSAPEKE